MIFWLKQKVEIIIVGYIFNHKKVKNAIHNTIPHSFFGTDRIVYFTVTKDIQGETYENFFINNLGNKQLIVETLFEIIYSIYLLNNQLGIIYNDNHFNNILLKPETKTKQYMIDKTVFVRTSNYRVYLYNFDLSYFLQI